MTRPDIIFIDESRSVEGKLARRLMRYFAAHHGEHGFAVCYPMCGYITNRGNRCKRHAKYCKAHRMQR